MLQNNGFLQVVCYNFNDVSISVNMIIVDPPIRLYTYIYIFIHIYMEIDIYVYIYIYLFIYLYMCVCACASFNRASKVQSWLSNCRNPRTPWKNIYISPPARWGFLDFITDSPASSPLLLLVLNGERRIAVGTAGPQSRAPDLSGHCRTSTTSASSLCFECLLSGLLPAFRDRHGCA